MNYKSSLIGMGLSVVLLISGCQSLDTAPVVEESASNCYFSGAPALVEGACLLPTWVTFGLQAQSGDEQWREEKLTEYSGNDTRSQLVRAVVLSWDTPSHWKEASAIYHAEMNDAPLMLQPLLRQWLNELEARRDLADTHQRGDRQRQQIKELQEKNAQLSKKLEALTAIEESMNARRNNP
ncbi:hypothetical protein [Phytohalomonas tamaricis]|uniref:hypothetical protein n=1 Tax=Phytohalomonas tamaricis TaxID=2081032 RepID=UPI000D0B9F58|nr:hypothetical protein [Phytohalomonas tamaricis]